MSSISKNEVAGEMSLISYFFSSPSELGEDWRQILSLKFIDVLRSFIAPGGKMNRFEVERLTVQFRFAISCTPTRKRR